MPSSKWGERENHGKARPFQFVGLKFWSILGAPNRLEVLTECSIEMRDDELGDGKLAETWFLKKL